jgi:copper resistance protein B
MMGTLLRTVLVAGVFLIPTAARAQDPHAGHGQPTQGNTSPAKPVAVDHSAHMTGADQLKEPIPPITDADRAAAFPPGVHGHATHDKHINFFVLFDQFEWHGGDSGGVTIDNKSWIGGDLNRVWIRAEGESEDGRVGDAHAHLLYGRSFARWWDVVAGARVDFEPGPAQAWAAAGIQGLAPYWFEIEATGYIGPDARTHARFEVEYELLLTTRVILQPLVELDLYGKSDPERGIGAGLSSIETGLRLRYEFRREFAPYFGVTWDRKFFGTADLARSQGEDPAKGRLTVGVRTWF